jgi:hypothetical protein
MEANGTGSSGVNGTGRGSGSGTGTGTVSIGTRQTQARDRTISCIQEVIQDHYVRDPQLRRTDQAPNRGSDVSHSYGSGYDSGHDSNIMAGSLSVQLELATDDANNNNKGDGRDSSSPASRAWSFLNQYKQIFAFLCSLAYGLAYVLLPTNNRAGMTVQLLLWVTSTTVLMVEMFCICLPGISDAAYVTAYVCGFGSPFVMEALGNALRVSNDSVFSTVLMLTIPVFPTFIFLAYALSPSTRRNNNAMNKPVAGPNSVLGSPSINLEKEEVNHWPLDVQETAIIRAWAVLSDTFATSVGTVEEHLMELATNANPVVKGQAIGAFTTTGMSELSHVSANRRVSRVSRVSRAPVSDGASMDLSVGAGINPYVSGIEPANNPMIGVCGNSAAGYDIDEDDDGDLEGNAPRPTDARSRQSKQSASAASSKRNLGHLHSAAFVKWIEYMEVQYRVEAEAEAVAAVVSNGGDNRPSANKLMSRTCLESAFWFLPRFVMRRSGSSLGEMNSDDMKFSQWCYLIAFICLYNGYFQAECFFTYWFRANHGRQSGQYVQMFMVFMSITQAVRVALKRVGLSIDKRKNGTASMYFFGEVVVLLHYYTFYRVLFETVPNWSTFFGFQALHLGSEWIMYPVRAHERVFQILGAVEDRIPSLKGILLYPELDCKDFINFLALDFGIRVAMMTYASAGMLLVLIIIDFAPWVQNDLRQSTKGAVDTYLLIIAAVVLELVNAYVMHFVFFRRRNVNVLNKVVRCFRRESFAVVSWMVAINVLINPVFVFKDTNGNTNYI